jgi:RNA-binding protein NOB1
MTSNSNKSDGGVYRALVIDSGPIIKNTATSKLFGKANLYYTTPAVIQEIRDSKARQRLEQLPFELVQKEPTQEGLERVIAFAKQTGDYASLSTVDMQILALCLDLEKEGCVDLEHIRTSPKRMIGLGTIRNLAGGNGESKGEEKEEQEQDDEEASEASDDSADEEGEDGTSFFTQAPTIQESEVAAPLAKPASQPKSWAKLVHSSASSKPLDSIVDVQDSVKALSLVEQPERGQFDDADDDENNEENSGEQDLQNDLESDFPSLATAATVAFEGSDDEVEEDNEAIVLKKKQAAEKEEEEEERKKQEALKPISNSGKLYNSFRKYGDLMKPVPQKKNKEVKPATTALLNIAKEEEPKHSLDSRILGTHGGGMVSEMNEDDDDGKGWITSASDIQAGRLAPKNANDEATAAALGPPTSQRAACTTTDFAMQNVLLQMGLPLLSVDGMKIRRLKSWVHRCGACFRVHTDAEFNGMKRLFCSHCGSDMMQRIAASVDGKTGRLKLHLKKNYKQNLRGTKFSLPKAGSVRIQRWNYWARFI